MLRVLPWVWLAVAGVLLCSAQSVHAARVIMKDGKIYEGKIIDDSDGDILIKTSPMDARPRLLPSAHILSVTPDPPPAKNLDPQRYSTYELLLAANFFAPKNMSLDAAPGLWLGVGLRFHPLVEVGAGLDGKPWMRGALAVTDGRLMREYDTFLSYGGGFVAKVFPFYQQRWKTELFVLGGYGWSRFIPPGSGDALKGSGFLTGVGLRRPLWKQIYAEARLTYSHMQYDRIFFLQRNGSIHPEITPHQIALAGGLSVRL